MHAIKSARRVIESDPEHPDAATLSSLVVALESGQVFPLATLYELSFDNFELALTILAQWRLERYYASKAKLLDVSLQVQDMGGRGGNAS